MSNIIPSADDLLKQIKDYIHSNVGNYSIDYYKPSLDYVSSKDTKLCFASPEYAIIPNTRQEGFTSNKPTDNSWTSKIRDLFLVKEGFDTIPSSNSSPPMNKGKPIIPPLKSSNDQGYIVSCSSILGNDVKTFGPYHSFDGNSNDFGNSNASYWHSLRNFDGKTGKFGISEGGSSYDGKTNGFGPGIFNINGIGGEWLRITLPAPVNLQYYDLYQRSDCCLGQRSPNTWYIFGSNDGGATNTQIDFQQDQFFDPKKQGIPNSYTVAKPGSYSTYTILVTVVGNKNQTNNRSWLQIEEFVLYAPEKPPAPKPSYTIPTSIPYTPPINMRKLDNNLYSPEHCMINLALKYKDVKIKEQFNKQNNTSVTQGLQLKYIPDKYFNDDVSLFQKYKYVDGQYFNTFTNIQSAISPNVPANPSWQFHSCEWNGYLKVENQGSYQITMASDDSSLLWFGPTALYDYNLNNTLINISGNHGTIQRTASTPPLDPSQYYPIRFQYGNNAGPGSFSLRINDEAGNEVKNCFYSLSSNPFTVFYALVAANDTVDPTLFHCYYSTTESGTDINKILENKNTANYAYTNVWSFGNTNQQSSDNYVILDTDGNLYLRNNNGLNSNITNVKSTCSTKPNCSYTLSLTNDGNLVIKTDDGNQIWSLKDDSTNNDSYNTTAHSIVNPNWQKDVNTNRIGNSIRQGQKISPQDVAYIISSNGMYKLEISPTIYTLVLKTSTNAYLTTSSGLKYTLESENAYYLYRIDYDFKLGNYFYTNKLTNTMEYIPNQNEILGFSKNYIEYQKSYPDSTITPIKTDSVDNCKATCNNDPDCSYFYYYEDGSQKYCSYNKDSQKTPKLIDSVLGKKVVNPSLFIRTKELKLDKSYMIEGGEMFPTNIIDNYNIQENIKLLDTPFVKPRPIGLKNDLTYRKLDCQRKQKIMDATTFQKDECSAFLLSNNNIEPMTNNYGYAQPTAQCGSGPNYDQTCPDAIKQKQIQPLQSMFSDYQIQINNENVNYQSIGDKINQYNATKGVLSDAKYNYDISDGVPLIDSSLKTKTVMDGLEEDTNMMIQHNKNIQLLGMITMGTLFITALFIGSR